MTNTYQVADNDLALSTGQERWDGGLRGSFGTLWNGRLLRHTTSRASRLSSTAVSAAAGVGAAGASNLLETLIELARHCVLREWFG